MADEKKKPEPEPEPEHPKVRDDAVERERKAIEGDINVPKIRDGKPA